MSSGSTISRRWQKVRRLPGRTPLRIKLITAVLALVAIALAVISVAGISVLRGYLLAQYDKQLDGAQLQVQHAVERCLSGPVPCQEPGSGAAIYWLPTNGKLLTVWFPVR